MNCKRCDRPIDDHTAGRETDACVAEVVMGDKWWEFMAGDYGGEFPCYYISDNWTVRVFESDVQISFMPSTDHNDAFKVVDRFVDDGWLFEIRSIPVLPDNNKWQVYLANPKAPIKTKAFWVAEDKSMTLAICKAALKAVSERSK